MQSAYTKWLRYTLIGGLFASLLIPFIIANGSMFPSMFFPFITGKNFVFRILVEVLFGAYVILALREPKYRPRFSLVLMAVAAFTLWAGVSTVMSVDPIKSFWSNFERMEGYITVLHLAAYFLVAGAVLTAENLWARFLGWSVGASVIMSVYGFLQWGGVFAIDQGSTRIDGTLGNAAYFGIYTLFNTFFALFLLSRSLQNKTLAYLCGGAAVLNIVMLFLSETRGTILGLLGGLALAGVYLVFVTRARPELKPVRHAALAVLIALMIAAGGFFALRDTSFIQKTPGLGRLATISLSDTTTKSRFMVWDMALQGFKEKPLFGWGQENFSFVFNKYYNPAMYDQEQWFDRAHDAFLDWLINGGAFGFLTFIALFWTAGIALARTDKLSVWERAALIGLVAGYAIHDIFVFDALVSYVQFFTVLALAHGLSQREVPGRVALARPLSDNAVALAVPFIIVATVCVVWFANAGGIKNATGLLHAIIPPGSSAGASKDINENLASFKTVLAGAPLGRQEATEQLLQFAPQVAGAQALSPEIKQEFYTTAHDAIAAMVEARPGDARLELFFGAFLDSYGQYKDALPHLIKAQQESPRKQQVLIELGQNNLIPLGDVKDALMVLQQAYMLDTHNDNALLYYASALYLSGEDAQADALLTERFGSATPYQKTLIQIFYVTKQYARAENILEAYLAGHPSDTQAWTQYAALFYAAGDKEATIAALRRGADANPAFASQAQQLITQLQAGK